MSITGKAAAAVAALGLATACGTIAVLSGGSASAATPPCAQRCYDIFSKQFGNHGQPSFVLSVASKSATIGNPIIMYWQSNNNQAEDFIATRQGTVSSFNQANLVSDAVSLHYGSDYAYEYEYAPYGVDTGLCIGTATTAVAGSKVSLQPCGASAGTVWIVDSYDGQYTNGWYGGWYGGWWGGGDQPLINGSDTNFSRPLVLTYPPGSFPSNNPRPQLYTTNLTGSTVANYGSPYLKGVSSNQLWSWDRGALP
jgi:hypothetical protein